MRTQNEFYLRQDVLKGIMRNSTYFDNNWQKESRFFSRIVLATQRPKFDSHPLLMGGVFLRQKSPRPKRVAVFFFLLPAPLVISPSPWRSLPRKCLVRGPGSSAFSFKIN